MTKLLSFSLFQQGNTGNRYVTGLLAQKELLEELYPNFLVRVYYDDSVPSDIINVFRKWKWETCKCPISVGLSGMYWRLLPIWEEDIDLWYSREADLAQMYTVRKAEQYWEDYSDACFCGLYVAKDVSRIPNKLFGGLIGGKHNACQMIRQQVPRDELLEKFNLHCNYLDDEKWLMGRIEPIVRNTLFRYEINRTDTFEGERDGRYICPIVTPPLDSVVGRLSLLERTHNGFYFADNISPYYKGGTLPYSIERCAATESRIQQLNITTR